MSSIGDGLVLVAFPLLALTVTSSPVAIAGVLVFARLPALLLSVPAGAVVDRVDRRRLTLSVSVLRALALTAFAGFLLVGGDNLAIIYAVVFVLGAGDMVFDVAAQACVPALVTIEALPAANGYLLGAEISGEQFVGPAVGGLALAAATSLPFVGDAASFVAQGALAWSALPAGVPEREPRRFLADVAEGLHWFLRHPLLRLLAGVVAALAFCQAMVNAEMVVYGTRVLHLGKAGYGVFFALGAVGNVVGAFAAGRVHRRFGPTLCLGAAAVLSGAAYLVLSSTAAVVVAIAVIFVEGAAIAVGNVTTLTLRQRVIPPELLGRVGAAFRTLLFGLIPLGAIVGGVATSAFGVRHAFALAGAVQLAVFLVAGPRVLRLIRREAASGASPSTAHTRPSAQEAPAVTQNGRQCCDGATSSGEAGGAGNPIPSQI